MFYDPSNLEVVCWSCYSGAIQSEEVLGYDTTIGADGWPVDERKFPTISVKKHDKKFSNIGQPRVCCSPLGCSKLYQIVDIIRLVLRVPSSLPFVTND